MIRRYVLESQTHWRIQVDAPAEVIAMLVRTGRRVIEMLA